MDDFLGSLRSYLIAIILIAAGVGALFYFSHKSGVPDTPAVDISPDTGYDWTKLEDNMHVTLRANNYAGYYTYSAKGDKAEQLVYLTFDYNQDKNDYKHVIGIIGKPEDEARWDVLGTNVLSKKSVLKTLTVDNYTRKMTATEFKDFRNQMLLTGVYDMDELQDVIIPYLIVPAEPDKTPAFLKYLPYVGISLGGILLILSIIFSIKNR